MHSSPSGSRSPLTDLKHGKTARILEILGEDSNSLRLRSLGLLPGQHIRRRNTAPLGDPVAYEVEGQKISLRRTEAKLVEIELL